MQPVCADLDQLAIYYTYILEFYVRNKELILVLTRALFLYNQVKKKKISICASYCVSEGHCSIRN